MRYRRYTGIAALFLALVLAGCADERPSDPFPGTGGMPVAGIGVGGTGGMAGVGGIMPPPADAAIAPDAGATDTAVAHDGFIGQPPVPESDAGIPTEDAGVPDAAPDTGPPGTVVGPPIGAVLPVGGGYTPSAAIDRFIELAGGTGVPYIVVPTADDSLFPTGGGFLTSRGCSDVTVVHTRDPAEANTEAFVEPIRRAMAIWFGGGRQWRIVDAYAGTLAETEMRGVLDRGGVVGGSSAGATILGSFMVRGDSRGSHIMIATDDPAHLIAFGYLRDTAIDQHWRARDREYDMVEVIELRPELLGISIDEGTAVVVIGDELELLGSDCIGVYHTATIGNTPPYEMYCDVGQRYDLANRVPIP